MHMYIRIRENLDLERCHRRPFHLGTDPRFPTPSDGAHITVPVRATVSPNCIDLRAMSSDARAKFDSIDRGSSPVGVKISGRGRRERGER